MWSACSVRAWRQHEQCGGGSYRLDRSERRAESRPFVFRCLDRMTCRFRRYPPAHASLRNDLKIARHLEGSRRRGTDLCLCLRDRGDVGRIFEATLDGSFGGDVGQIFRSMRHSLAPLIPCRRKMGFTMRKAKIGIAAGLIFSTTVFGTVPDLAHAQDAVGDEAAATDGASVESEARKDDLHRKIRALRWGVAASTIAIPLGTAMWVGGAASCVANGLFSNRNCSAGQKATIGIGVSLSVAGTAGMIASAILLRRRKQERKGQLSARRLHWSDASGSFVF